MVDVHIIPDDLYHNIFARLPAKPLLRSRCVSKHWNRIISDPYFMKSKPSCRKMAVFTPHPNVFNGTELVVDDYLAQSRGKLDNYLLKNLMVTDVDILGTFNGIVFLVVHKDGHFVDMSHMTLYQTYHLILYNPFTGAFKILPDPYSTTVDEYRLHGLSYGATMDDDLKIVRFRDYTDCFDYSWKTCDAINLKTGSWSTSKILIRDANIYTRDENDVGMFINGFLYWIAEKKIVALNVKEMVISYIFLPFPDDIALVFGTWHGCVCMITTKSYDVSDSAFNVWVMKKEHGVENPWSILHTFEFLTIPDGIPVSQIIKTLGDGRILMAGGYNLIMFDTLKHSFKMLHVPPTFASLCFARAIEYDESLISPSDICGV